jgi:peptide-methionine (S)-S-oxide reductase
MSSKSRNQLSGRASTNSRVPSRIVAAAVVALLGALVWRSGLLNAEPATVVPAPKTDSAKVSGPMQIAVISGGCFWGVQGVFQHVKGVSRVVSGYAGGDKSTAEYETVSSGTTGHAESVQITFDPAQISYGQLLQIAFSVAFDPTELNRQGPDSGTQYRSAIWYLDDTQKGIATAYVAQLNEAHVFPRPIVTRVDPLKGFYPAEGYHQDYLFLHPSQPYIAINDIPKVNNLKRVFPDLYNQQPMLVSAR